MGLMGFIAALFGGGTGRNVIKETAEVFRPNAEASAQRAADRAQGAQQQFAAEFAARERRGWFNSLVDGLNRLPRPALAYGTIGLFVYAMRDPVSFGERMQGLALVPDQLWWILGAIVTFYFGARELKYSRDARFAAPQLVSQVVSNVQQIRTLRPESPGVAADTADPDIEADDNAAVNDWREAV